MPFHLLLFTLPRIFFFFFFFLFLMTGLKAPIISFFFLFLFFKFRFIRWELDGWQMLAPKERTCVVLPEMVRLLKRVS